MKAKYLLLIFLGMSLTSQAQIFKKLKKKAEKAVERTVEKRVEKETEKETDKALDEIFEGDKDKKKHRNISKKSQDIKSDDSMEIIKGSSFFPDGEVIFEEYFEGDAVGDFPARWETNSGGEVISIYDSKALRLYPNGRYIASANALPENYALDFYFITNNLTYEGLSGSSFNIIFGNENSLKKPRTGASLGFSLWIGAESVTNKINVSNWGNAKVKINNNIPYSINDRLNNIMQFTIVVNGPRLRLYIDNEKAIDLPSLLNPSFGRYVQFYLRGTDTQKDHLVALANVVITEEGEDLRSKLLKGGFSTTKILFNSGSAQLKSESFDFLNKLGKTLQEDSSIKVKIIGHTDSDGKEQSNLLLSQERAESVAQYLTENFDISENNIQTQGMGESKPVTENNTSEGKAQNRRVEFKTIK